MQEVATPVRMEPRLSLDAGQGNGVERSKVLERGRGGIDGGTVSAAGMREVCRSRQGRLRPN